MFFLYFLLACFGVGCLIGLVYSFIRYGIPLLISIPIGFYRAIRDGIRDAKAQPVKPLPEPKFIKAMETKLDAFNAKYAAQKPTKPFFTECREAWNRGWEDVRRSKAASR